MISLVTYRKRVGYKKYVSRTLPVKRLYSTVVSLNFLLNALVSRVKRRIPMRTLTELMTADESVVS